MEKIQKLINNNTFKSIFFSVLFVLGFNYYFYEQGSIINRSFFNLILLVLCIVLINKNSNVQLKSKKLPMLFAFIFSLALIFGKIIYTYNDIVMLFYMKNYINSIIALIGFTKIIGEVVYLAFEKIKYLSTKDKTLWKFYNLKHIFLILWIVIFISWIPTYLAYYPGSLDYDARNQTMQATGYTPFTKHHPPLHTFIWKLCMQVGPNIKIDPLCIYAIIQMLFMSFVFAKLIHLLIHKKVNNWIILLSILFFTINHVIILLSFNMTKDIFFAGFMLLFVLQIISLINNPDVYLKSKLKWLSFFIISLLMCLFRNNAIYVYIIFGILLTMYLKIYWKKVVILLSIPLIVYIIVNSIVYKELGVLEGKSCEKLSVPMQQIAMVVHKYDSELDNSTKESINKFLSYEYAYNYYNPRFADGVKNTFNSYYFDKNKGEFIQLWFKLFTKYPLDYLSSFLSLNLPYWYFDSQTLDEYSNVKYIEDGIDTTILYPSVRKSVFPKLLEKYTKVKSFEFVKDKPFIENMFSVTTPLWLVIFTMFVIIYKKQYKKRLIILPALLLWLTHMAGPVSNFRYIFPIFVQYPVLVALMFSREEENTTSHNNTKKEKGNIMLKCR